MTGDTGATPDLVSVVTPAYNAAGTIDETLQSVRAQTYTNLEILVIDDGSTDETVTIVERHAVEDRRVRLIRQENGGVARARNRGIAEAKGGFIAPLDSDDLWRPEKIELQMQAMAKGGAKVGLVYTWFALVDDKSVVYEAHNRPTEEGDVLRAMYRANLVGNGSSPLMRKEAVLMAGGYDPGLRDAKAQGCEDLLLYATIAETHEFALVRDFLTGYRQSPDNMSGDAHQMVRSWEMVRERLEKRHPEFAAELDTAECSLLFWLYARSLEARRFKRARSVVGQMLRSHPRMAAKVVSTTLAETMLWILGSGCRAVLGRKPKPLDTGKVSFLDPGLRFSDHEKGPRIAYNRMLGQV
jgi:glycosyltransferase involved in cell wall biosynthesis